MNTFPYLRIAGLIFNQPQMVTPAMLDMATQWASRALQLNLINVSVQGSGAPGSLSAMDDEWGDMQAVQAARDAARLAAAQATGVQVVPVHGLLVPRAIHMNPCETATSYEALRQQLGAAVADPMIEHIVLDVDSPGGSVAGAFELADAIHAWGQQKPITAVINYSGYSAAYALASAATDVVASPSAGVGSIGVIARHIDLSEQHAADGVKVTTIYAGAHKNDLSPHEPLSDQAAESLRQLVNQSYDQFVGNVARYRGVDPAAVRSTEAQVYHGTDGVARGLIDRLESPQAAVDRIASEVAAARSARARGNAPKARASVAARAAAANLRAMT